MKRSSAAILSTALVVVAAAPASGYVPATIDYIAGVPVILHWPASAFPIPFQVTPGLSTDTGGDRQALDAAMATWSSVPDSAARVFVEAEAAVEANVFDGINAIEFSNDAALDAAGFVALTFMLTDPDGTIREADMLVNDRTVGFTTQAGGNVGLDFETAMLRQVGRLLGLSLSPLGGFESDQTISERSSVMFTTSRGIGETARNLADDDIGAMIAMYPNGGASRGSISGQVTLGGTPVFGAHVVAFDPISEVVLGAVTLPDGSYRIDGVPPGLYLIEALPLSAPAALGGIFTGDDVDTDFTRAFFGAAVRLSAGTTAAGISLEVTS